MVSNGLAYSPIAVGLGLGDFDKSTNWTERIRFLGSLTFFMNSFIDDCGSFSHFQLSLIGREKS